MKTSGATLLHFLPTRQPCVSFNSFPIQPALTKYILSTTPTVIPSTTGRWFFSYHSSQVLSPQFQGTTAERMGRRGGYKPQSPPQNPWPNSSESTFPK